MKLLLVGERTETRESLLYHLRPLGVEIIHYLSPIKAMDNVDEIDPDIILFSAGDFPRHWKPFLKLSSDAGRQHSLFILLRGENFSVQEAAKAVHLGVSGIIQESLPLERAIHNLEEILLRFGKLKETLRKNRRYLPAEFDDLEFILTHPNTLKMVTGLLIDISLTGLRFTPDFPQLTADLGRGTEIPTCSLQVGADVLPVGCKVVRNEDSIGLQFVALAGAHVDLIKQYLDAHAARALALRKFEPRRAG